MLEKLQRIALALAPLQRLCLLAIAAMCVIIGLSIFGVSVFAGDAYLVPAFVGLLWLLCLYTFIVCFRWLPARVAPDAARLVRLRAWFARVFYWLLAVTMLGITVAVVLASVRFARIWLA